MYTSAHALYRRFIKNRPSVHDLARFAITKSGYDSDAIRSNMSRIIEFLRICSVKSSDSILVIHNFFHDATREQQIHDIIERAIKNGNLASIKYMVDHGMISSAFRLTTLSSNFKLIIPPADAIRYGHFEIFKKLMELPVDQGILGIIFEETMLWGINHGDFRFLRYLIPRVLDHKIAYFSKYRYDGDTFTSRFEDIASLKNIEKFLKITKKHPWLLLDDEYMDINEYVTNKSNAH